MALTPVAFPATSRRRFLVGATGLVAVSAPGMLALAGELLKGALFAFVTA